MSDPVYQAWYDMKRRCHDPTHWHFDHYGARGITVCAEWRESFQLFSAHVGPRPPGQSLDRLDNDRGYEPGNVRWASREEQQNNKRTNRKITHEGRTQTIAQWARELGVPRQALHYRVAYEGMTGGEAIAAVTGTGSGDRIKVTLSVEVAELARVSAVARRYGVSVPDILRLLIREITSAA